METSKVESTVRNQAKAKLNQLEQIAIISTVDESVDSRYSEAKKSRKLELERVGNQQMKRSEIDEATSYRKNNPVVAIQQMLFALITSRKIQSRATVDPVASIITFVYPVDMLLCYSSSRKDPDATKGFSRSAKQLKNESAAKQLAIYKSWMSTAERNSNVEIDKTLSTLKMERING
ncbi:hypothetical protein F511_36797 [Dorcoceras hygrometricum]|uniref:Uncharacterized protein n=1 Tax=Dorcoceras hygrometricum TaxID=472368 RepID=A0A2Z7D674_9LAMI|nr:hypothetical protein F511_36797 [Dorcoceras hygrometricum]